jgi:hypothetical protein
MCFLSDNVLGDKGHNGEQYTGGLEVNHGYS